MQMTRPSRGGRVDPLTLVGGVVILVDAFCGRIAILWLDLSQFNQLGLSLIVLLGVPMYLLDVWLETGGTFSLLGLLFIRWAWRCLMRPTPVRLNPLDGNLLLIVALVLLQTSKLRGPRPSATPS